MRFASCCQRLDVYQIHVVVVMIQQLLGLYAAVEALRHFL